MTGILRQDPDHLVVGHITKPHGTRGELQVWPLTDRPAAVFSAGAELVVGDSGGQLGDSPVPVTVAASRPFKRGLLVSLAGVADRSAVEELAGRYLLAPVGKLEPLGEDEVFYHQLLGLRVELQDGLVVGRVREIYEVRPADLLEVQREDGRTVLIPFTRQIVERVDVAAGLLVIAPPAGLLEL